MSEVAAKQVDGLLRFGEPEPDSTKPFTGYKTSGDAGGVSIACCYCGAFYGGLAVGDGPKFQLTCAQCKRTTHFGKSSQPLTLADVRAEIARLCLRANMVAYSNNLDARHALWALGKAAEESTDGE